MVAEAAEVALVSVASLLLRIVAMEGRVLAPSTEAKYSERKARVRRTLQCLGKPIGDLILGRNLLAT